MAKTAHRAISHVETTNTSQASRRMAKPCSHEVGLLSEEWNELVNAKMRVETALVAYSKSSFSKEQARIRKSGGNTLEKWLGRRAEMEEERQKLIEEKRLIESRMRAIKDRVKEERRERSMAEDPSVPVLRLILAELKAIKSLLELRQPIQE